MKEQLKLALFASTSMLVFSGVMTGLSASLVDMAAEFGVATTRAGIFYTIHFVGFVVLIVLSLAVRGLKGRLILTILTAAVYAVALGTAGLSVHLTLVLAALFVSGGSGGILESHTSTMQVMTTGSEGEAGAYVSMTQVFFALGALLAPLYLALRGGHADWRGLFLILAALSLVAATSGMFVKSARFSAVRGENEPLHLPSLLRVSLALVFYVGAEVTLFGWIPTVMEVYRAVPAAHARLAPSVFWLGMLAGRVIVARLAGRFGARRLLRLSAILGILSAVGLTLVATEALLWLMVLLVALACAGIWPLLVATSGSAGNETGTTIAIAAGGVGGALFPYIAGLSAEILPGNFIPIVAAPLFLFVLFLSGAKNGVSEPI